MEEDDVLDQLFKRIIDLIIFYLAVGEWQRLLRTTFHSA